LCTMRYGLIPNFALYLVTEEQYLQFTSETSLLTLLFKRTTANYLDSLDTALLRNIYGARCTSTFHLSIFFTIVRQIRNCRDIRNSDSPLECNSAQGALVTCGLSSMECAWLIPRRRSSC
jgi:hypothetical protein